MWRQAPDAGNEPKQPSQLTASIVAPIKTEPYAPRPDEKTGRAVLRNILQAPLQHVTNMNLGFQLADKILDIAQEGMRCLSCLAIRSMPEHQKCMIHMTDVYPGIPNVKLEYFLPGVLDKYTQALLTASCSTCTLFVNAKGHGPIRPNYDGAARIALQLEPVPCSFSSLVI
jgi:hypothetical protein